MKKIKQFLALALAAFLFACSPAPAGTTGSVPGKKETREGPKERTLHLLTSNKILARMALELSDGFHQVDTLAMTANQMSRLHPDPKVTMKLGYHAFFYVGANYEPFAKDFISGLNRNEINVVNLSRGIDLKRYLFNNMDQDNPYYLMNSQNYIIALSTIKNTLKELDPARKLFYDKAFEARYEAVEKFRKEQKTYMSKHGDVVFLTDSDLSAYVLEDYRRKPLLIGDYLKTMEVPMKNLSLPLPTNSSLPGGADKVDMPANGLRIFIYTDELSLQKYGDEILRFHLVPLKLDLYDYDSSIEEQYESFFMNIRQVIEEKSTPRTP